MQALEKMKVVWLRTGEEAGFSRQESFDSEVVLARLG